MICDKHLLSLMDDSVTIVQVLAQNMKRHASHRSYIESTGTGDLVDSEALLTMHSHAAILGMWGCLPTLNFFNSNFMEAWFCFFL